MSSPLSGYLGVMWGRESADFKAQSHTGQRLERVWSPSPSLGAAATAFQGIFYDGGYGTPGAAGRCGSATDATCNGTWGAKDMPAVLSDLSGTRNATMRGSSLIYLFGSDFQWENAVKDNASGPQGIGACE